MEHLFKLAEDFAELAGSKGRIVENNDEILKEISSLKDFDKRVELAEENFEKLGEGSSRTIFQISDSLVLKVAHKEAGIQQNSEEMRIKSPCLNNVLAADTEGKWIIVRWTENITEDDFEDVVGISFKTFGKALYYKMNNEVHDDKPKDYEEIIEHPLFKCLITAVVKYDLQTGDISKISSWGLLDGKVLLRDFGLTKEVFADYYEADDDNTTSTISGS